MKIEKISENQIKFTLTRSDLASRQIRLSELTYGTEKAKGLFQDMVEQANLELGYDISEFPLMIEAIPVSMDCIVLMITMVDDPEEVDSRVSDIANFSDLFRKDSQDDFDFSSIFGNTAPGLVEFGKAVKNSAQPSAAPGSCLFSFSELEQVIDLAKNLSGLNIGESSLYKCPENGRFYLDISSNPDKAGDLAQIISIASEFGSSEPAGQSRMAYINEHFEKIIDRTAVSSLSII